MKTFPTLYKRTKTGAIQQWHIAVEPYKSGTHYMIVKQAGQLGGKLTTHEEVITEGKQKRTPYEQAVSQTESDWKRKRDEGYKSLEDLSIKTFNNGTYALESAGAEKVGSLTDALTDALPQFNTDASGNAKPMLAKTVNWDKVKYPCLIQPKLDGVRCLMVCGDESIVFLSRSGKPYTTLNHIEQDVLGTVKNVILDGEIYSEELSFQDIVAAVKKQRPDSLKLKFRAYDIVSDDKQQQRWERTVELVDSIESPYIQLVLSFRVDTKENIKQAHDQWVSEGYEGAMIRHLDGLYGQGQRSSDLLKVKEFDETEFKFKQFETGLRDEDLIAVCENADGKEFRAKMIGTREEKEVIKNYPDLEGSQLTVKHFGWTDDGLPRFPIGKAFRDE